MQIVRHFVMDRFSVWDRQARFDQIYNQERNLRSFDRFARHRLPAAAPRPLRFLVTGCATATKLARLFAEFPGATVASTQPVMKAIRGQATRSGLRHSPAWSTKRELLLRRNVARYAAFCAALRQPSARP